MDTIVKRGGFREKSGRKPLPPEMKKTPITIYIEDKIVDELGGKAGTRKLFLKFLEQLKQKL